MLVELRGGAFFSFPSSVVFGEVGAARLGGLGRGIVFGGGSALDGLRRRPVRDLARRHKKSPPLPSMMVHQEGKARTCIKNFAL